MRLGGNNAIGPLALTDLIGLDVVISVMQITHDEFADTTRKACPPSTWPTTAANEVQRSPRIC